MATAAKAPQIGSLTALQQVAKGNGERTPAIADRVYGCAWLCLALSGCVGWVRVNGLLSSEFGGVVAASQGARRCSAFQPPSLARHGVFLSD